MEFGIEPQQLGMEFSGGVIIGILSGIAAKKLLQLFAILVGIEVALFKFLESRGILEVNWEKLTAGVLGLTSSSESPPTWVMTILSTLSISAGFVGGFWFGFRKG